MSSELDIDTGVTAAMALGGGLWTRVVDTGVTRGSTEPVVVGAARAMSVGVVAGFDYLFDWRWRKGRLPPDAYVCRMGLYDLRRDEHGNLARVPSRLVGAFRQLTAAGPP